MSISPQLVFSTSVAGLLRGSDVFGLARCCSPLFLGLAAVQPPPAGVVAVLEVPPVAADVDVFGSSSLFPQPAATARNRAAMSASIGRGMGGQDNHGLRDAVSPRGPIRPS